MKHGKPDMCLPYEGQNQHHRFHLEEHRIEAVMLRGEEGPVIFAVKDFLGLPTHLVTSFKDPGLKGKATVAEGIGSVHQGGLDYGRLEGAQASIDLEAYFNGQREKGRHVCNFKPGDGGKAMLYCMNKVLEEIGIVWEAIGRGSSGERRKTRLYRVE